MSDLILYHGTIANFSVVNLMHCRDRKDFGKGFYTTTNINQARDLAVRMKNKEFLKGNTNVKAYVYIFKFNKELLNQLNTHHFQTASISWIDYILKNRYSEFRNEEDFDVVIGKVADVAAVKIMNKYINRYDLKIPKEEKLKLIQALKPDNLSDQYCFKSLRAIRILNNTKFKIKEVQTYGR